jgi:hypothetical protein
MPVRSLSQCHLEELPGMLRLEPTERDCSDEVGSKSEVRDSSGLDPLSTT